MELKKKLLIGGALSSLFPLLLFLCCIIVPMIILEIIDIDIGNNNSSKSSYSSVSSSSSGYWWPIGSSNTTTEEDIKYASDDPVSTKILKNYSESHHGIDISGPSSDQDVNIIAVKAGEVVYPTEKSQTQNPDDGNVEEESYGNYVVIKHSDGTYTLYGHLKKDSITVMAGDVVEQGQVIGKMGSSGSTSGKMLHFEVRVGNNTEESTVDPSDYIDSSNTRSKSYGNGNSFSLNNTSLTKKEFISKMESYCTSSGNSAFCNNFSSKAKSIYKTSNKNNINPELVVVTAGSEQGWKNPGGCANNNYWGIGVYNGNNCGSSYSSLENGIAGYAKVIAAYSEGGSNAASINKRNTDRENAGCDSAGHGPAGTFAGMQSVYSWIGDYRYNPGTSGLGGCYYLNIMYGSNYCSKKPTCNKDSNGEYKNCSANSKTTICEQNDYTAWQIKEKIKLREVIFGL